MVGAQRATPPHQAAGRQPTLAEPSTVKAVMRRRPGRRVSWLAATAVTWADLGAGEGREAPDSAAKRLLAV